MPPGAKFLTGVSWITVEFCQINREFGCVLHATPCGIVREWNDPHHEILHMARSLGLPIPGTIFDASKVTHYVVYWCPALKCGSGGWYQLGQFSSLVKAEQGVVYARLLGYHSAKVQAR